MESNKVFYFRGIASVLMSICLLFMPVFDAVAYEYSNVVVLEADDDLPFKLKELFLTVDPGTVIELPQGTYYFDDELILNQSHITL